MSEAAGEPLLVACLCAAWCGTCRDYRVVFDQLSAEFGPATRFVWVDIEDDEAIVGAVDVDDFPTLLLAQDDEIRFFGPLLPHAQTARQLLQRALRAELAVVDEARLAGLPARLRTRPG